MTQNILKVKNFDFNKLSYSDVQVNKYGGKFIYLNYDNKPVYLQTPKLGLPFGASSFDSADGTNTTHSLQFALKGYDSDPRVKAFYELLDNLDNKIVQDGVKNSGLWFKQKRQSLEVTKALYKPMIRPYIDKETGEPSDRFPPMFRVKLPSWDGRFTCEVFNDAREQVPPLESLVKQSTVQSIIRCDRLWFGSGNFGLGWRVIQARVTPPSTLSGFAFVSDSEDSDSEDSGSDDSDASDERVVVSDTDLTDSDAEESEDSDHELEAPSPPVVPKKTTKRKRKKKVMATSS